MVPKVSVIVPIYNVEKYLDRCLESLLNQTLKEIEIILVDDESTDNCPQMCEDYKNLDNRIKVIHKKNCGLGFARNSGLEIASGDFIAFVDSDDYIDKTAFEKMYNMAVNNDADTCIAGFKRFTVEGKIMESPQPYGDRAFIGNEIIDKILVGMIGSTPDYSEDIFLTMAVWSGLYSRNLIVENNIKFCSERVFISEDIIFDIDYFLSSKKVCMMSDTFYYYCENRSSLTHSYIEERYKKQIQLFEEINRKLENCKFNKPIKCRLQRSFLGRVRQCIYSEVKYQKFTLCLVNIKKICNDEYLIKILHEYDLFKLPFKYAVFYKLMKLRYTFLIYCVIRVFIINCVI